MQKTKIEKILRKYREEEEKVEVKETHKGKFRIPKPDLYSLGKKVLEIARELKNDYQTRSIKEDFKSIIKELENIKNLGGKLQKELKEAKKTKSGRGSKNYFKNLERLLKGFIKWKGERSQKLEESILGERYFIGFLSYAAYRFVDRLFSGEEIGIKDFEKLYELYYRIASTSFFEAPHVREVLMPKERSEKTTFGREFLEEIETRIYEILKKLGQKNRKITRYVLYSIIYSGGIHGKIPAQYLLAPVYLSPEAREEYFKWLEKISGLLPPETLKKLLKMYGQFSRDTITEEGIAQYLAALVSVLTLDALIALKIPEAYENYPILVLETPLVLLPYVFNRKSIHHYLKDLVSGTIVRKVLTERKFYREYLRDIELPENFGKNVKVTVRDASTARTMLLREEKTRNKKQEEKKKRRKHLIVLPAFSVYLLKQYPEMVNYLIAHELCHVSLAEDGSTSGSNIRKYWEDVSSRREKFLQNMLEDFYIDTLLLSSTEPSFKEYRKGAAQFTATVLRRALGALLLYGILYNFKENTERFFGAMSKKPGISTEKMKESIYNIFRDGSVAKRIAAVLLFSEIYPGGKEFERYLEPWEREILEIVRDSRGEKIPYRVAKQLIRNLREEVALNYGADPELIRVYREKLEKILELYFGENWVEIFEKVYPDLVDYEYGTSRDYERYPKGWITEGYEKNLYRIAEKIRARKYTKVPSVTGSGIAVKEYIKYAAGAEARGLFLRKRKNNLMLEGVAIITDLSKSASMYQGTLEEATAALYYSFKLSGTDPKKIIYIRGDSTIVESEEPLMFNSYSDEPGSPQGRALEKALEYLPPETGGVYVFLSDGKPTDPEILESIERIEKSGGIVVYIQIGTRATEFTEYLKQHGHIVVVAGTKPWEILNATIDAFEELYTRM